MMKKVLLLLAAVVACAPMAASAQYSNFVGSIPTNPNPLAIATDGTALYFVTFDEGSGTGASGAYKIADPAAAIGSGTGIVSIVQYAAGAPFPSTRGLQGIQVDSSGNIYISGDTGAASAFIRKFNSSFVEDAAFTTAVSAVAARIAGCALVSDSVVAGGQLLGAEIEYFNTATGDQAGLTTPVTGINQYVREPVFNSTDNVIYPLRNDGANLAMLTGYVSGVSTTTGGGTFNASVLIPDGASISTAQQHGYYDAANIRLVTMDQATPPTDSLIRFWDVSASGATLTENLAFRITGTSTTPATNWNGVSDAVIIGTRLYVTSVSDNVIYVFDSASSVDEWMMH